MYNSFIFDYFFQKSLFTENYFLIAEIDFTTWVPIVLFLFAVAVPHCYVIATGSKLSKEQSKSLGQYQLLTEKTNDFPAWKLSSDDITRYLYRYANGHWHIGSSLGWRYISKSDRPSDSPFIPGLNWLYLDDSLTWAIDNSLYVSRFLGE